MTISDSDRLHSRLARYEDMFRGYRMEIVGGNIVMSPLRPFHNETIVRLWTQLERSSARSGASSAMSRSRSATTSSSAPILR